MGRAVIYGFGDMLRTEEELNRARMLCQKDPHRFEIQRHPDSLHGRLRYIPLGTYASQEQYNNGKIVIEWVKTGKGNIDDL